ncbi:MAG: type II toxin-antitoxin system VapC family toxin [Methylococcales bacterium]|jgi:PIN domain nuclease of toxin-antitoxin system|nr:type II toxin-antitoxin system VapC family toxin [Methylococcales bacterium]MBT7409946.1 type II toxin-antitoxin system VapC family toxin [Methylococcales bacterium]
MNFLLDTHILIWSLENNPKLSDAFREVITDGKNMIFVSAVSAWEISIKKAMGKLNVPDNLTEEIKYKRFTPLNINFDHAKLAGELPHFHKDPFDRLLIAQSIIEKLVFITNDQKISQYQVDLLETP